MTTRIPRDTVNDNEIVMRRVTRTGVTRDEDQGTIRPSSDAFLQGGPEGNVSVYLASETTPERITREFPDTYVALVLSQPPNNNYPNRLAEGRSKAIGPTLRFQTLPIPRLTEY